MTRNHDTQQLKLLRQLPPAGPLSGEKILAHPDHLIPWSQNQTAPPVGLEIDPTNQCNLTCWFCTNAQFCSRHKETLELVVVERTLKDFAELGGHGVTFTGGGEPTKHPELYKMMDVARELGLDFALITNGTTWVPSVVEHTLEHGTWVRISLDASDQFLYSSTRGENAFDVVVANIQRWVLEKRRRGSKCTVGVGYLTEERTVDGMVPAAQLAVELGVDYLQFRPLTFQGWDNRRHRDSVARGISDHLAEALVEAGKLSTPTTRIISSLPKYRAMLQVDVATLRYCSGVHFASVLAADGEVYICCHMRGLRKYSLGSVYERTFREIWEDGETRRRVYDSIDFQNDCMSACRFYAQNKLLGKPDPAKTQKLLEASEGEVYEHVNFL